MPRMSGIEVLASQREAGYELPPIYAFTADLMPERVQEYLNSGFDGCVHKPFDWDALKDILVQVAKRKFSET